MKATASGLGHIHWFTSLTGPGCGWLAASGVRNKGVMPLCAVEPTSGIATIAVKAASVTASEATKGKI